MQLFCKPLIYIMIIGLVAACTPQKQAGGEMVLGEGIIKVLDDKRLLIQETTSVVSLELDADSARFLCDRYEAGQQITLLGVKVLDEQGNSSETIKAIRFEDGARFNISS